MLRVCTARIILPALVGADSLSVLLTKFQHPARKEVCRVLAHLKIVERHHRVDAKQRGSGPGNALSLVIARRDRRQGYDVSTRSGNDE
jgi:hypothetical protein